jgi:hypothetical protein
MTVAVAPPGDPSAVGSDVHPIAGGYGTEAYAAALAHIGEPVLLPRSSTWVLRRPVAGGGHDLAGPYPLLRCADWGGLAADLDERSDDLTFCAVTDPLAPPPIGRLTEWFPDCRRPWKPHHVVDLPIDPHVDVSAHHRRNLRRARVAGRRRRAVGCGAAPHRAVPGARHTARHHR